MESRTRRRLTLAAVALATLAAVPASQQPGTFALFGGQQESSAGYWPTNQSGLAESLNVKQYDPSGKLTLTEFRLSMGATMHFFVIRDDFKTFHHYVADNVVTAGSFRHRFTKDPNHKYYLYTDSAPMRMDRQVFRFTVESAGEPKAVAPSMTASSTNSATGPYTVIFSSTTLKANQPYLMLVTIDRNGKGAQDLTPFLGAAAHMVMINTSTLQYVFTHPTLRGQKLNKSMSYTLQQDIGRLQENSQTGPNQQVEIPGLPAGTYKLWYEFKGGASENEHVAPFTVVVE